MVRVAAIFGLIGFLLLLNPQHLVAEESEPVVEEAPKPLLVLEFEQYKKKKKSTRNAIPHAIRKRFRTIGFRVISTVKTKWDKKKGGDFIDPKKLDEFLKAETGLVFRIQGRISVGPGKKSVFYGQTLAYMASGAWDLKFLDKKGKTISKLKHKFSHGSDESMDKSMKRAEKFIARWLLSDLYEDKRLAAHFLKEQRPAISKYIKKIKAERKKWDGE